MSGSVAVPRRSTLGIRALGEALLRSNWVSSVALSTPDLNLSVSTAVRYTLGKSSRRLTSMA